MQNSEFKNVKIVLCGFLKSPIPPLQSGAASVCLLSMTFLLGASRLALFTFEIHASIRWNWDPSSAWVASVSGVD